MTSVQRLLEQYIDDRESLSPTELERLMTAVEQDTALAQQLRERITIDEAIGRLAAEPPPQEDASPEGWQAEQSPLAAVDQTFGHFNGADSAIENSPDLPEEDLWLAQQEAAALLPRGGAHEQTGEWFGIGDNGASVEQLAGQDLVDLHGQQQRSNQIGYWITVSLSLALAIAAGAWFAIISASPEAMVEKLSGSATLARRGSGEPISVEMSLYRGDRVVVPGESVLSLRRMDGSIIELGGGTTVELAGGNRVIIEHGALRANVSPQTYGAVMVFQTPLAEARVQGASFSLVALPKATRLEVQEGRVELARRADGQTTLVQANQFAMATADQTLFARPVVFPDSRWKTRRPASVGLDEAGLDKLASLVRGHGCVVRHGYLVYQWGDPTRTSRLHQAGRPFHTHMLLRAIEERRLASLETPVAAADTRLRQLNASLAHKDAAITWRQLAAGTSGYGTTDQPGAAFLADQRQQAFLVDTLYSQIYQLPWKSVDASLFYNRLTTHLGCEDGPTMWSGQPGGVAMSPRDLARFGWLYLHQGRWHNVRLLQAGHIALAIGNPLPADLPASVGKPAPTLETNRTIAETPFAPDAYGSYSFGWWTNGQDAAGKRLWPDAPLDAFAAIGSGGEDVLLVIPSLNLIATFTDARLSDWAPGKQNPVNQALRQIADSIVREESSTR